ncbi:hypothetical protein [Actinophytocola xanthii]|uniref:hypothetical protein n=1 Tax=Actinophytocola xanthii TaxID=1912961 RepID=UPI001177AB21|nr:hypothetical protein [Actinophytocola xanthii]
MARVGSTGAHLLPFRARTGPTDCSSVQDPSGFAKVVDISDRSPATSTRLPCRTAAAEADAWSAATFTAGGAGSEARHGAAATTRTATSEASTIEITNRRRLE